MNAVVELPPALILEIFKHLDARELTIVSCVCRLFRALASDDHGSWKNFYCERWGLPQHKSPEAADSWRDLYVAREGRCKALLGKFCMDRMVGHAATVRAMRMLPSANLVASGGNDSCIRLWDLSDGLPLACSPPLDREETIRAIALDPSILATGGTAGVLRVWNRSSSSSGSLFDVLSRPICIREHSGPISCLGLDSANLYSGSWDMSVKVWNRSKISSGSSSSSRSSSSSSSSLAHWDWVLALAARGHRMLSTAGSDAYTWDIETGRLLRFWPRSHEGQALAVEGNRSGHYIITGGEDGAVRVFDNRVPCKSGADSRGSEEAIAAWLPHSRAVQSLAFDDPWLISASADGTLALMDLRSAVRSSSASRSSSSSSRLASSVVVKGNMVQRMLDGGGQSVHAVDIGSERIACAGRDALIRVWDFSRALEMLHQVQASRNARRMQRKLRQSGKLKDHIETELPTAAEEGLLIRS